MTTMPRERDRHREPGAQRHGLAQDEPSGERGEERRHAHQHERVGDGRARERGDEEEERAGEEQARPAVPACRRRRTACGIRRPCITSSTPATNSAMNTLRQNTISQALVIDSWRTRMPPDDQQIAATIMNRIARRCARGTSWGLIGVRTERRDRCGNCGTAVARAAASLLTGRLTQPRQAVHASGRLRRRGEQHLHVRDAVLVVGLRDGREAERRVEALELPLCGDADRRPGCSVAQPAMPVRISVRPSRFGAAPRSVSTRPIEGSANFAPDRRRAGTRAASPARCGPSREGARHGDRARRRRGTRIAARRRTPAAGRRAPRRAPAPRAPAVVTTASEGRPGRPAPTWSRVSCRRP